MTRIASSLLIVLLGVAGCTTQQSQQRAGFPSGQWIDLSHDFSDQTIYWPTAEPFKFETVSAGMTDKGYYYSAYKFCAAEHGGTHIDAPVHFSEGRKSVDQLEIDQLTGPAIKIDVSSKATSNRDYLVSPSDLESWESAHGKIPDGVIVLLYTGWSQYWPDKSKYLGTTKLGAEGVAELHFPGLAPEAARWLADNRKIKAIGLDTASIDFGQSQLYESHRTLMGNNIPAFENVTNLERVPDTGSFVIALPMKIKGGSGGPLRIIALVPNHQG